MTWFLFAIASAVLASAASITTKKALFKEHAMEYAATLSIVTAVISIPLFFLGSYENLTFQYVLIIFVTTFLISIGYVLTQKSSRHLEISTLSPLKAFSPVIVAVLAFIILDESLSRVQTAGIILIILGAYIIEAHKGDGIIKTFLIIKKSIYIHYFFIALVIYGFTTIVDRYLLGTVGIDPIILLAFLHIFLAVDLLIMLTIFHDGIKGIVHGFNNLGWFILVIGFLTLGYRIAAFEAIALASVGLVSSVKPLSILFTTILGGKVFHEKNLLKKSLAATVMLAGVLLIIL